MTSCHFDTRLWFILYISAHLRGVKALVYFRKLDTARKEIILCLFNKQRRWVGTHNNNNKEQVGIPNYNIKKQQKNKICLFLEKTTTRLLCLVLRNQKLIFFSVA